VVVRSIKIGTYGLSPKVSASCASYNDTNRLTAQTGKQTRSETGRGRRGERQRERDTHK